MAEKIYTEMSSLGNRFVVLESDSAAETERLLTQEAQVRELFQPQAPVAFDQMLIIEPGEQADFRMRIFNRDGQEVEQCGNGLRCVAYYVYHKGRITQRKFRIETVERIVQAHVREDDSVSVGMGAAIFDPQRIPAHVEQATHYDICDTLDVRFIEQQFAADYAAWRDALRAVGIVSMGNPHCVVNISRVKICPDVVVQSLGAQLQNHAWFPKGVNVGFMGLGTMRHIGLRVFERGVGETQACGSGGCAAFAVARLWGLAEKKAIMQFRGGGLWVHEDAEQGLVTNSHVVLCD